MGMVKNFIKKIAETLGYTITGIKYIPKQFVQKINILGLNFDHVIYNHLSTEDEPGKFFFIQIGAFDGKECDPLYKHIVRYNWSGIFLEPQPGPFKDLMNLHRERTSNLSFINAAISDAIETKILYTLTGDIPVWAKGMASFNKQNILKHSNLLPDIEKNIEQTTIDCITFEKLFSTYSVNRLDLLQVDTEGFDAEIIYMFPFKLLKPTVIHFESKHLSKNSLERLLDFLGSQGYEFCYDGEEDIVAVQR